MGDGVFRGDVLMRHQRAHRDPLNEGHHQAEILRPLRAMESLEPRHEPWVSEVEHQRAFFAEALTLLGRLLCVGEESLDRDDVAERSVARSGNLAAHGPAYPLHERVFTKVTRDVSH